MKRKTSNNTFQGWVLSFPALYVSQTQLIQNLQYQKDLVVGKALLTFSKRCRKTQHWVLYPQAQEYVLVIPTKYKDLYSWADCVDRFIRVVKQTKKEHTVIFGVIIGPAHVV